MGAIIRQGFRDLSRAEEIAYARFLAQGLLKFAYMGQLSPTPCQDDWSKEVHEEYLGTFIRPSGPTKKS